MKKNKFKQTEIGKIPEDWEIKKAEDFCFKVADGTHDSPKKKKSGKYLITSKHLNEGYLDFTNAYLISKEDYEKINKRSKVDQWDVIVGMIGTIGETYLEKNDRIDYAIKNVGLFKSGGNEIVGRWVFYYMQSKQAKEYMRVNRAGTTQEYITLGALRKFPIPYPKDKSEMIGLIRFLDSLQGKIEILREMNKTLEKIGQAIFKHWFVDFEFPNDEGEPYKSSSGEMIKSSSGNIPKNWNVGKISDLVDVKSGFAFKSSSFDDAGSYGLVTIKNVQNGSFVTNCANRIAKILPQMPDYCLLKEGDILLSLTGNVGRTCFVYGSSYLLNQRVAKLVPIEPKNSAFVYFLFRQNIMQNMLINISRGTAQQNLSPVEITRLNLIIPPRRVIKNFAVLTSPIFEHMVKNESQNQYLAQIRDSLLPKLMSGKIRVKIPQEKTT